MLKIILSGLFVILTISACKKPNKELNLEEIKISPGRGQSIDLSSIIADFSIFKFETTSSSLFGEITKLIYHDGKYFLFDQSTSNTLFIFNENGKFLNKIYRKGRGASEFIKITGFALDTIKRQILLGDNNSSIKFFDYDLNYLKTEPLRLIYKDFELSPDMDIVFNGSKLINYKEKKGFLKKEFDTECYSVWVWHNKEFSKFLPFSIKLFPNGASYNELKTNFFKYKNTLYYNQPLNDTIYKVVKQELIPNLVINFGDKATKEKLTEGTGEQAVDYFNKNPDAAFMPQNFIETDYILKFDYFYGNKLNTAIKFKNSKSAWLLGEINNDLFGVKTTFDLNLGDNIFAVISPNDVINLLKNTENLHKAWYSQLKLMAKDLKPDDNSILVKFNFKKQ